MKKADALAHFGGNNATAKAIGLAQSTVSGWGELVPWKFVMRVYLASGKQLDKGEVDYEQCERPPRMQSNAA